MKRKKLLDYLLYPSLRWNNLEAEPQFSAAPIGEKHGTHGKNPSLPGSEIVSSSRQFLSVKSGKEEMVLSQEIHEASKGILIHRIGVPCRKLGKLIYGGFGILNEAIDGFAGAVIAETVLDIVELNGGMSGETNSPISILYCDSLSIRWSEQCGRLEPPQSLPLHPSHPISKTLLPVAGDDWFSPTSLLHIQWKNKKAAVTDEGDKSASCEMEILMNPDPSRLLHSDEGNG